MSSDLTLGGAGSYEVNEDSDKADFEVVGTIGTFFPDRAGKVVRFSVRVRGVRESIIDLKYFGTLPGYSKGDRVRVTGNVSSEKSGMTEQGRNGKTYDKWVPLLAARKVEILGRVQGSIPGGANDNARGGARRAANGDDDIPF